MTYREKRRKELESEVRLGNALIIAVIAAVVIGSVITVLKYMP